MTRVLLAIAVCTLGSYQAVNMCASRSVAAPNSLFALLPAPIYEVTSLLQHVKFEQQFFAGIAVSEAEHQPQPQRIATAQAAVNVLTTGPDRDALQARLALLQGLHDQAFAMALRARQIDIVNSEIDRLAGLHQTFHAIALEQQVIDTLQGIPTQREALAAAYWQLGALQNEAALHDTGTIHRRQAAEAFEKNVALTPFSGRALLSAGYAELALAHIDRAERYFSDALMIDPASASADIGLARIELRRNNRDRAYTFFKAAFAIAPAQHDVMQLKKEIAP